MNKELKEIFNNWVKQDTSHTNHYYDLKRFDKFVYEAVRTKTSLDESILKGLITEAEPNFPESSLKTYMQRLNVILEFIENNSITL